MLIFFIPVLLVGKVNIIKDIEDDVIDIRNTSDHVVIINTDIGSTKLEINQAIIFKCNKSESKYISIEQDINEDFYVDCNSKISITNE